MYHFYLKYGLGVGLLLLAHVVSAQVFYGDQPLAHTYSIIARDTVTGEMGVAVQSHWFSVGTIVSWGEAGVGVVATQSLVNPDFGPNGLTLMKTGLSPEQALKVLLENDEGSAYRQVALLDATNPPAVHTGETCIPDAGHRLGKHYSIQANMMDNPQVWVAMEKAFLNAKGSLAERLVAAMEGAEAAGGDVRGKQSAALLVVNAEATGQSWIDRKVDLRIEDHPEPVKEMRRLLTVHQAYQHMNRGDLAIEVGDEALALKEYGAAMKLFPENLEMKFWTAVSLANSGKIEDSLPLFREVFEKGENWKKLLPRLVPVGLLNVKKAELERILQG